MIIDTHSHLNFKTYDTDRDEVLKRNLEHGIICVDVGTKYETSKKAVELANKNENIFSAIGLHPIHIKTDLLKLHTDEDEGDFAPLGEELDIEKYRDLAKNKKVVAIGEIGLDYYYRPKTKARLQEFKKLQKEVFERQLDLAAELNLPVIVHCRMSHDDTIDILSKRNLRGVIHCFTGTWQEAQRYLNMGFYLGINGIIFKFNIDETIKNAPLERLLTETDCPYLTPPQEGKDTRNEPMFVKHVIDEIANLRGISPESASNQIYQNAKKLFGI